MLTTKLANVRRISLAPQISVPFFNNDPQKTIINKKTTMNKLRLETIKSMDFTTAGKNNCFFIELLHTYPAWYNLKALGRTSAHNPYGHTAISFYKTIDGSVVDDFVANVGTRQMDGTIDDNKFMHIIPSHQYFFNSIQENENIAGNQQNGVLERSFIGINIPIDENTWNNLVKFYLYYKNKNHHGEKFTMATHIITNRLMNIFPFVERGNCCYWTSKGLEHSGLIDKRVNFPMIAFYNFLLNVLTKNGKYFSKLKKQPYAITFYKGLHHDMFPKGSFMYPFYWFNNGYTPIWKKETMANVMAELIEIKNNMYDVSIQTNDPTKAMNNVIKITSYIKDHIFK